MAATSQPLQACPHAPLSGYDWSGRTSQTSQPYCPNLTLNPVVYYLITTAHVSAYWLMGVLSYKVLKRFTRWDSVYFWSLQWTAWSIILHCIADDLHLFSRASDSATHYAHLVLLTISQPGTSTSYALILWSRLHLLCDSRIVLRFFLAAIILTSLPVSTCKIAGYSLATTSSGNVKLGQQLLDAGSYLMLGIVATEVSIMLTYIYQVVQSEHPGKDAATRRLLAILLAAMGYSLLFSASCIGTMLAGLPTAHSIVSVGFAFKTWAEYGVLLQVVKFSGRVQREANQLPSMRMSTCDVEAVPSVTARQQKSSASDRTDEASSLGW